MHFNFMFARNLIERFCWGDERENETRFLCEDNYLLVELFFAIIGSLLSKIDLVESDSFLKGVAVKEL